MWIKRLASLAFAFLAANALAEPRIAGMDAQLEADLARGDYLFVWDIDMATIGRGDPNRTWRTYYDGLMYAVTEARRLVEPGTPAQVNLAPMPAVKGWDDAFSGTLVSRETYLDGEPVVMHAEITRRNCDRKRAQLFFALSYAPRDDARWQEMRKTRAGISCDKSKN
jgi:hypothetical protein